MKKVRDLTLIALIYLLAYGAGIAVCLPFSGTMLRYFVFDAAATFVTYLFSEFLHNSSVYDPYWSLTPMVMSVALFLQMRAVTPWHILFLIAFNLWSLRLTLNWVTVFTDFSYEDWRYRKYRAENRGLLWIVINFFGIHMVPTLVVFAGMLPLFEIAGQEMDARALPGIALILAGIALEFFADRQMHAFLSQTEEKKVCRLGLWNYSRHPNYLGEITVWVGCYLTMLPFAPERWYYGVGMLCVALLFNIVSIPLMETRQRARRSGYGDYCASTSRLLLLPHKQ